MLENILNSQVDNQMTFDQVMKILLDDGYFGFLKFKGE